MISRMERRLADWTHLGVDHQEDTQILRCAAGCNNTGKVACSTYESAAAPCLHLTQLHLMPHLMRPSLSSVDRRYGVGQKYGSHYDSLVEQSPRIATALIYLQVTSCATLNFLTLPAPIPVPIAQAPSQLDCIAT